MGDKGKPGVSLRAWRDFFPNANIHGADIDRDCLFQEERINTTYVDQTDPTAIQAMWEGLGLSDLDIIIDDGLHIFRAGSTLLDHSFQRLHQSGVYIIEDILSSELPEYHRFFGERTINYQLVAGLHSTTRRWRAAVADRLSTTWQDPGAFLLADQEIGRGKHVHLWA